MKFKKLYQVGKEIDKFKNIRTKKILLLLHNFHPKLLGRGKFKRAFLVKVNKKELIFKVGSDVKRSYLIYKKLKGKHFNVKVYWVSKKCMLQKKCNTSILLKKDEVRKIKNKVKRLGYYDARKRNLGKLNKRIVAFDLMPRDEK